MSDELNVLNQLENRIQKLMTLHEGAKKQVIDLNEVNKSLRDELEAEKYKVRRIEKEMETLKVTKAIGQNEAVGALKNKVNDIIREIDHNISVINHKVHK